MAKIGRNDPCPCGSGQKYKKCCLRKDEENHEAVIQARVERERTEAERRRIDKEEEKLFEDEIPDIVTASEEEGLFEGESPVDEVAAPEDESFRPDQETERKPRRRISNEVPEISEDEKALVDAWWARYKKLKGSDEIKKHLETFFSEHPGLVPNLELHHEVLFELGAQYLGEGRPDEYINLLLRIRRDFPEAFLKSFGYYDRNIICHMVVTGHKDKVEDFLGYFKEYPDHDPDNLFPVIDFLMATNCQDIVAALVRDIYYEVCTSSRIMGGEDILRPLVFTYFIPFLKPDFSDHDMERLAHQLKEIKVPLRDEYYRPDFLKEMFHFIYGDYTHWNIQDCRTNAQIYKRYYEITLNFMGFLHENKPMDWMAAEFYRSMVSQYLVYVIPEGKRPKETFIFTKNKIEATIARRCRTFFSFEATKTLGSLKALYFFAEYLETTESLTRERKESIQQWCTELFNKAYPFLVKEEFSAGAFEKFPA